MVHATGGWLVALIILLIGGGGYVIYRIAPTPPNGHKSLDVPSTTANTLSPQRQQQQYAESKGAIPGGVLAGAHVNTECISAFGVTSDYVGPFSCAWAETAQFKGFYPIFYAGPTSTAISDHPTSQQIRAAAISTCLYWAGQDSIGETYVDYPSAQNWDHAGHAIACTMGDDIVGGGTNIGIENCVDSNGGVFTPWSKGDPCTAHLVAQLQSYQVSSIDDTAQAMNTDDEQCSSETSGKGVVSEDVESQQAPDGSTEQVLYALCLL